MKPAWGVGITFFLSCMAVFEYELATKRPVGIVTPITRGGIKDGMSHSWSNI